MGIIAGILIIIISIAHNIYGEKIQMPAIKKITSDPVIIGSLRIMIYQGGFILLAIGIVQLLMSLHVISLSGFGRYLPLGIITINFLTAALVALFLHREILKVTLPQFIIFLVIILLQLFSL